MNNDLANTDIAYLAGFFDGEGCCGIQKMYQRGRDKPPTHIAYCTISQTRREVLDQIRAQFGGNIRFNSKCSAKGIWAWQCKGRIARTFLAAIYPFLRIKRAEVDLIVAAFAERVVDRRAGTPQVLRDYREGKRLEIMSLRG